MLALLLVKPGVIFADGFDPGPPRHPEQPARNRHFLPEAHGAETLDLERMQRLKFHACLSLPAQLPAQEQNSQIRGLASGSVGGEPRAEFWGDVGAEDRVVALVTDVEDVAGAVDFGEECGLV